MSVIMVKTLITLSTLKNKFVCAYTIQVCVYQVESGAMKYIGYKGEGQLCLSCCKGQTNHTCFKKVVAKQSIVCICTQVGYCFMYLNFGPNKNPLVCRTDYKFKHRLWQYLSVGSNVHLELYKKTSEGFHVDCRYPPPSSLIDQRP